MAQLILENLEPEILERLDLRAKRLGTTPQREASRLLVEGLRGEPEPQAVEGSRPAPDPDEPAGRAGQSPADPRFVRRHGFLAFTGPLAPEDIPDHRALREDRIDALLKDTDA
jgi:alkanesulfonate monooxygenase SsuD/methylene tetrahydromethanopterin reductase-like flavin-dependent oxidoreductase (luciferase family)